MCECCVAMTDSLSHCGHESSSETVDVDKSIHHFTFMSHTDGCMKPLIIHFVWSVVSAVSTGLVKIQVPYFPTDNAHQTYNAHPKLFCIPFEVQITCT